MQALRRSLLLGLPLMMLPSLGYTQDGHVVRRTVNIDYYLLSYFNRVAPLPREVGGDHVNYYPLISLFSPSFYYVSHDLDFLSTSQSVRTMAMGGAGVALEWGAPALAVNPAGLSTGPTANEIYFGLRSRFGAGECELADDLLVATSRAGRLRPLGSRRDLRFLLNQGGMYLVLRPFDGTELGSAPGTWLQRLALAGGYRRFVEMANPTNEITTYLPEGGFPGLSAVFKSAAQSREKGGVDAFSVGLATGAGDSSSAVQLSVGGAVNVVSGRIQADQLLTMSLLTQILESLPGDLAEDAYVKQKFTGTAFDLGVQVGVLGGGLRVGGTFRPSHTLKMRGGRYSTVELDPLAGEPPVVTALSGRISDYDMALPSSLRLGASLSLSPLLGDGEDHRGLLGYPHRFLGRAEVAVDYARQNLSEATVQHRDAVLDNRHLADDPYFQAVNLALADAYGGGAVVDPMMPHRNGSAELRDKSSIHVGVETPIFDRPNLELDLRLGYETVPFSFASLVLGDPAEGPEGIERHVLRKDDGTPVMEDIEGEAFTFGLGYTSGLVRVDVGFRSVAYDFVSWWGSARPPSWYDPVTGIYEPLASDEAYAAMRTEGRAKALQISASLGF